MSFGVSEQLNQGIESNEVAFWFKMSQVTQDLVQQSCDGCGCYLLGKVVVTKIFP